jgi:hypothetical protein
VEWKKLKEWIEKVALLVLALALLVGAVKEFVKASGLRPWLPSWWFPITFGVIAVSALGILLMVWRRQRRNIAAATAPILADHPPETNDRKSWARKLSSLAKEHGIPREICDDLQEVVCDRNYPRIMSLGSSLGHSQLIENPIWDEGSRTKRIEIADRFRTISDDCPALIVSDLFLINGRDSNDVVRVLTYFTAAHRKDRATAYLLCRRVQTGEHAETRAQHNANEIEGYAGLQCGSVTASALSNPYAISIKPDPESKRMVALVYGFWSVELRDPPTWLSKIQIIRDVSGEKRRLYWSNPLMLESEPDTMAFNADVVKAIHKLFGWRLLDVKRSLPDAFVRVSGKNGMPA